LRAALVQAVGSRVYSTVPENACDQHEGGNGERLNSLGADLRAGT